ncbi:MAG: UDP-N-acetylglucosamine--N-acetylmuramyl-(pentapeptide) pyrophosphoryl-undecaprenol N-acetylglucosamine transferase [Calditrichaeota bacterium]|nr:UDP-N-acetylglucosamine--N-acetylmuramyl-(pentapeptide) pyrophosphoryl-undecaprenol N-acetylglucosamine transferase [Calditrichota bacterium]
MRVLLTGGGSGGHVSPLLAIAEALREHDPDLRTLYLGVRSGLERELVPRAGIRLRTVPATGMPATPVSPAMLRFALTLLAGIIVALVHLITFRPRVIVASGGYASSPAVFASAALSVITFGVWRIPVYLHEQNAVPGRMNVAASRIARQVGVVHPSTLLRIPSGEAEVVGYPVRAGFTVAARADARDRLEIPGDVLYLVVTGGSQGARTINRALVDGLPRLAERDRLAIIHATGTARTTDYDAVRDTHDRLAELTRRPERYQVVDYLHEMPLHLAAADLAVMRAGAGSLFEVCTLGVPALVIPKANLPGDSQVANARQLAAKGAVEILYEQPALFGGKLLEAVSGDELAERISVLLNDEPRRRALAERARDVFDRRAAERIAKRVVGLGKRIRVIDADDTTAGNGEIVPVEELPASPAELRRHVERVIGLCYEDAFAHGPVRDHELLHLDDLDYLRYRGAALLAHSQWSMRNEGVKLIALTRHREKLELILHVISDRTPTSRWQRLLGGDFLHVGFERRNAVTALALLGVVNEDVLAAISAALTDPYYEVRAAALRLVRALIAQGRKIAGVAMIAGRVRALTGDRNIEVRWEALHTFGLVGPAEEILELNRRYALADRTPLREAVLRSYHALLDRHANGRGQPWRDQLLHDLDRFAITSLAFHPHFPLKDQYTALQRRIDHEQEPA